MKGPSLPSSPRFLPELPPAGEPRDRTLPEVEGIAWIQSGYGYCHCGHGKGPDPRTGHREHSIIRCTSVP